MKKLLLASATLAMLIGATPAFACNAQCAASEAAMGNYSGVNYGYATESVGGGREVSTLSWSERKKHIDEAKKASGSGWALVTPTSYWWAYDRTRADFHERVRRSMKASHTGIWQGETLRDIAEKPRAKLSTRNRSVIAYANAMHVDLARMQTRWRFNASGYSTVGSPNNARNDYQGSKTGNWN